MIRRSALGGLLAAVVLSWASGTSTGALAIEAPPGPSVDITVPASWPHVAAELDAAAYLLLEADTGQVLAEHAADDRRAVASTIKVLTALTALERVELHDEVVIGEEVVGIPGSGVALEPGDTWTVEQLLDAMIARSGNDAAEALAIHVGGDRDAFLQMMREDAAQLGLDGVTIVSPSGLDDANQLTARDLGTVARVALTHPRLRPVLGRLRVSLPNAEQVESRNLLLTTYRGATGLKTGFTEAAGNSIVASARRGDRELIAVVLGSGEDPARFEAATQLLDLGFEAFGPEELSAELRFAVAGGSVALRVEPIEVTLPVELTADVALPLTARPPDHDVLVELRAGEDELSRVTAVLDTSRRPAPATGGAALGAAAVDGAYAALRAAAATDGLR